MMKDLETAIQSGELGNVGDIELEFSGLRTNDFINPSQASALYLDISQQAQKSESYFTLRKIIDHIINECLARNLVTKDELARSFINYDHSSREYVNRKLNVALVQTASRHGKKFNAKEIIDKYGNATILKPAKGKKVRISQVHLSCKAEYESATSGSKQMSRMKKELFANMFRSELQL